MPRGGTRTYRPKPTTGSVTRSRPSDRRAYRNVYNRKFGNIKVHRAVCEAFHGPCPEGMETLHIDEDALNNRADNLEWGTRRQNLNAPGFIAYCKTRTGENHPRNKTKF